ERPRPAPCAGASAVSARRRPAGSDGARLRIAGWRTWCCGRRPGGAGFRMRTGDRKGPAATGRPAPRMSPVSALGGGLLLEFAAPASRRRGRGRVKRHLSGLGVEIKAARELVGMGGDDGKAEVEAC